MTNLFQTLYNIDSHDTDDVSQEILNDAHGHLDINEISKYYDLETFKTLTSSYTTPNLKLLHLNARSLPRNFEHITSFLKYLTNSPDIIAITETWLTKFNKDLFQLEGYHAYHLVRHTNPHGGVSLFVSKSIQTETIDSLTLVNELIEINTIKIKVSNTSYVISAIYRPNSKHQAVDEFTSFLSDLLLNDSIKKHKIVLLGDFNINLLEHTSHTPTNNYLVFLQSLNFIPHISRPTRIPNNPSLGNPSLLDHIYSNFSPNLNSGIIRYPISDHLPVFLNISLPSVTKSSNSATHKTTYRLYNTTNKSNFRNDLISIDLSQFCANDVNLTFSNFVKKK